MFDFWPVYSGERFRASWPSCYQYPILEHLYNKTQQMHTLYCSHGYVPLRCGEWGGDIVVRIGTQQQQRFNTTRHVACENFCLSVSKMNIKDHIITVLKASFNRHHMRYPKEVKYHHIFVHRHNTKSVCFKEVHSKLIITM